MEKIPTQESQQLVKGPLQQQQVVLLGILLIMLTLSLVKIQMELMQEISVGLGQ